MFEMGISILVPFMFLAITIMWQNLGTEYTFLGTVKLLVLDLLNPKKKDDAG